MTAKPIDLYRAPVTAHRDVTAAAVPQLPATGFVRQAQLIPTFVPFSSATLWRKVQRGEFPRPVKLSHRVTAWRVEDIRSWMQAFGA